MNAQKSFSKLRIFGVVLGVALAPLFLGMLTVLAATANYVLLPSVPPRNSVAPQHLVVSFSDATSVLLAWEYPLRSNYGFLVERSLDGESFIPLTTTSGAVSIGGVSVLGYYDTNIPADTNYWYRVKAYGLGTVSPASNIATFPSVPPHAAWANGFSGGAILFWDTGNPYLPVWIERSLNGIHFDYLATIYDGMSAYVDTNVPSEVSVWYRVRHVVGSAYSNTSGATTGNWGGGDVAPPTNLSFVAASTSVVLVWKDNAVNENGYIIERSSDPLYLKPIGSVPATPSFGTNAFYIDKDVVPETLYYYRVSPGSDGTILQSGVSGSVATSE